MNTIYRYPSFSPDTAFLSCITDCSKMRMQALSLLLLLGTAISMPAQDNSKEQDEEGEKNIKFSK